MCTKKADVYREKLGVGGMLRGVLWSFAKRLWTLLEYSKNVLIENNLPMMGHWIVYLRY